MKEILVGGIGILSGVILFGLTLVGAAIYSPYLATVGYSSELGLYVTALKEIGILPIVISIALFTSRGYFLVKDLKS
ncbi:hypothetical protein [Planococcus sp. YIM B11945]|uniref:hypothetical protein n=1 Tax=Planococcus sp. YIM B11945 TaxID=3435410 RepID=UPI003D7C9734